MAKVSAFLCFSFVALLVFVKSTESKVEELNKKKTGKKGDIGFYVIKRGDVVAKFTNYGATIVSLYLPDKNGKVADVVLGYDTIKEYQTDTTYFGATVGRVANRIGGAKFTLNGTQYKLVANEKGNMLHGGPKGFGDVVWKVKDYHNEGDTPYITFSYHSADGEEGFPGALEVNQTFTLMSEGMAVTMKARALNKATPVNIAQHAYWNLGGHNSGNILSNEVQIFGSQITPVDKALIPTGKLTPVKGTPYDFLEPKTIKENMKNLSEGYDINYAVDGNKKGLRKVAMVFDKKSGRVMQLLSNQPGVQFYTGNYVKNLKGKGGFVYQAHAGLCLETQGFPDSVNHPNFPSQIVKPGKVYLHRMVYKFSTKSA